MPAVSTSQQNFFKMVKAYNAGKLDTSKLSESFIKKLQNASIPKKDLPKYIKEDITFKEFLILNN